MDVRLEENVLPHEANRVVRQVELHRFADEARALAARDGCDEEEQLVDEIGLEERRRERGPALEQE